MNSPADPENCSTRHGRPPRSLPKSAQRPASMLAAFCFPALAYLALGAVLIAIGQLGTGGEQSTWLGLHLVFVGGISQVLIGAGQFFSTAYLATEPPARRMTLAQSAAWNTGTLLVAIGVPTEASLLSSIGGLCLLLGLGLYVGALLQLERRSLQTARWTLRWYYASAAFVFVGALIGTSLAAGASWTHGNLVAAHLVCNLGGWFGGAIVGTLHTFYPSLTHSKLRFVRLQGPTFVFWYSGILALAAGQAFARGSLIAAGWAALTVASIMLAANIIASAHAAARPIGLPARLVGTAQLLLVALMTTGAVFLIDSSPSDLFFAERRATLGVLALGWIGITFAGSFMQLMTVLVRVRDLASTLPPPAPLRDSFVATGITLSAMLTAIAQSPALSSLLQPALLLTVLFALPIIARCGSLAVRALFAPQMVRVQT